jgi:hypothetical protein
VRRVEVGRSHVDGDTAVVLLAQLEAAVRRVDDDGALVGQPALADEADEAARAVAALLDLVAAAAVEDAVAEVGAGARRRLDDEDLVGTDAEAPIGEALDLRVVEHERLLRRVDDDEVVAGSLHLGEANAHRAIIDARSLGQYSGGSPGGRVLKRRCTQRYCAGLRRISPSIQRFIRAASATASSLGKPDHGSS